MAEDTPEGQLDRGGVCGLQLDARDMHATVHAAIFRVSKHMVQDATDGGSACGSTGDGISLQLEAWPGDGISLQLEA